MSGWRDFARLALVSLLVVLIALSGLALWEMHRAVADISGPADPAGLADRAAERLARASALAVWLVALTAAVGLAAAVSMLAQARSLRRAGGEAAALADEARAANRAKSRFMTMMSHELRTPLNGVMGLIALVKQSGLSEQQLRLIDQVERSGNQIVGLLRDMLDFSDLESRRIELETAPFPPSRLADQLTRSLAAVSRRRHMRYAVRLLPGVPERLNGDSGRMGQALTHFCTYFVEVGGVEDLTVSIRYDAGDLICEIDVDMPAPQDGGPSQWLPEDVFGQGMQRYGSFASDSVGPMIARGLVELMGGTVALGHPGERRACLTVAVPHDDLAGTRRGLRIEARSDTTRLLLHAIVDEAEWRLWMPGMPDGAVTAVLYEAIADSFSPKREAAAIAALRAAHPDALLVGAGTPHDASLFDRVCPIPASPEALARALAPPVDQARAAAG